MRRGRLLVGLVAALLLAAILAAPVRAADPLPVPWDVTSFVKGGSTPDTVPGANDFACKPSVRHPRPVVLVHGFVANLGDNWSTMAPLLKNNGFCVFGLTYGRPPGDDYFGGLLPMEQSAEQLRAFVDRVLAATGADKVDVVGHSEGTIMPRWWMSFLGGAKLVDHYVMLTPLWNGTNLAEIGDASALGRKLSPDFDAQVGTLFASGGCGACPQFATGSPYFQKVDAVGKALGDVKYTNVVTRYDELVSPYTSGILDAPNVTNFVLQDVCAQDFSEHAAVAFDPMAAQIMLNALDSTHARPLPCTLMTPAGAPNPPDVGLTGGVDLGGGGARESCRGGKAVTLRLRRRRGERIRRVTARVGSRTVGERVGRNVRRIRIAGLTPGKQTIKLKLRGTRGTRSVKVRQTVVCAR